MKPSYLVSAVALTLLLAPPPQVARAQGLSAPLSNNGGAAGQQSSQTPDAPTGADRSPLPEDALLPTYRLDTGDTVQITVARHEDHNRQVPLLADATVMLPRMEKPVVARGMTCQELATALEKALSHPRGFVLRPGQVNVQLVSARARRIYVRGNAARGGDFNLLNGWRVTELLAVIGNIPQPERVTARITNPQREEPVTVDLVQAIRDPKGPANIPLREGDTLTLDLPAKRILLVKGELSQRGQHEIDERFTLKQALVQLGVTENGATGDLVNSYIHRHTVPGDPTSPTTKIPVNLLRILTDDSADMDLQDYDTLEVPVSMRFYYVWGEIGGARKRFLPLDRKTYLLDVMSDSGNTSGQAKIGDIQILRQNPTDQNAPPTVVRVDYGKFFKSGGDPKYNPEILPNDIIFVDRVKRTDYIGGAFTFVGFYNMLKGFLGGF
jgi:Periplasmic protein involved in polysaccharide export